MNDWKQKCTTKSLKKKVNTPNDLKKGIPNKGGSKSMLFQKTRSQLGSKIRKKYPKAMKQSMQNDKG